MHSQPITFETRLPRQTPEADLSALSSYAELFSRACRVYLARTQRGESVSKPAFTREFGVTGRQFNAVKRSVEGMVDSKLSNLSNYLTQYDRKIEGLQARIRKSQGKAKRADLQGDSDQAHKWYRSLAGMHRRIQILAGKKADVQRQLSEKAPTICFGSRRLFRSQNELTRNGFESHSDWKIAWRESRARQFFVLGSSDEAGGCQGCTILANGDGTYKLRVLLPPALAEGRGDKYVWLDDLSFPYLGEKLEAALAANQVRAEMKKQFLAERKAGTTALSESTYLKDAGQPLSFRFIKDRKGWRVLVTTSWRVEPAKAEISEGVIGVDFNDGFVSVTELNGAGQKVWSEDWPYRTDIDSSSRQNKTQMQVLAKRLVDLANATGKPLAIESLNFRRKKAGLQKGQDKSHNRMLSALSYTAFRTALTMQCLKKQVALIPVNPAYTSVLGRLKYARETDFNTHQASAWVIARRGMGLRDKPPSRCTVRLNQRCRTFCPPEEGQKDESASLNKLMRAFSTWVREQLANDRRSALGADLSSSLLNEPIPF